MALKVKRVSDLRIDSDLTQEDMAKILGITRSKYSKIEIGVLDFDLVLLNKFANYFKVSVDYIYGLTNDKNFFYGDNVDLKKAGVRLREYRKEKGMSQEEVCSKSGLKQSSYSRYELGIGLTGYKLYVLSKTFGFSMDSVMGRYSTKC